MKRRSFIATAVACLCPSWLHRTKREAAKPKKPSCSTPGVSQNARGMHVYDVDIHSNSLQEFLDSIVHCPVHGTEIRFVS